MMNAEGHASIFILFYILFKWMITMLSDKYGMHKIMNMVGLSNNGRTCSATYGRTGGINLLIIIPFWAGLKKLSYSSKPQSRKAGQSPRFRFILWPAVVLASVAWLGGFVGSYNQVI